jgi:CheY-like chemotaxis protein
MTRRILIVDSNEAFATMLQESLEQNGEYRATVTAGEDEALQALSTARFDLAIVDMGLTNPGGATVARTLRQQQAGLRLMLIPLMGEELPSELTDLDLAVPREHIPEIVQEMTALSQEINAEGVILTREEQLIAHAGRLSAEGAGALAQAVAESWRTSARVAQILGREQPRFEQSVESGEHVFYSLAVADDVILSAAMYTNVPLGIIRHRAKKTADALRALMKSG